MDRIKEVKVIKFFTILEKETYEPCHEAIVRFRWNAEKKQDVNRLPKEEAIYEAIDFSTELYLKFEEAFREYQKEKEVPVLDWLEKIQNDA